MNENQDPTPDASTFKLDEWLTDDSDRSTRPVRYVDVYKDLSIAEEINEIAEQRQRIKAGAAAFAAEDESVGDARADNALDEREAALLERLQSAKVRLSVVGLIRPEIEAATEGLEASTPEFDYALLQESVIFPGGGKLTPEQWRKFHNTIGQGQFQRIIMAYKVATFQVPEITAPFSRKS